MSAIQQETATVWRAPNGRRYFHRRSAFMAVARERMMRDHEPDAGEWDEASGIFTPGVPCGCSWCRDVDRRVQRRYARILSRPGVPPPDAGAPPDGR